MSKYTLDCIENGQYVFVEKSNEENQIVLDSELVPLDIQEGEIVSITKEDDVYTFAKSVEEKNVRESDVQSLIDKLKNK